MQSAGRDKHTELRSDLGIFAAAEWKCGFLEFSRRTNLSVSPPARTALKNAEVTSMEALSYKEICRPFQD
jgi:hypothetical protein